MVNYLTSREGNKWFKSNSKSRLVPGSDRSRIVFLRSVRPHRQWKLLAGVPRGQESESHGPHGLPRLHCTGCCPKRSGHRGQKPGLATRKYSQMTKHCSLLSDPWSSLLLPVLMSSRTGGGIFKHSHTKRHLLQMSHTAGGGGDCKFPRLIEASFDISMSSCDSKFKCQKYQVVLLVFCKRWEVCLCCEMRDRAMLLLCLVCRWRSLLS